MQALNMRFEPPEAKNRWDGTLFTVCYNGETGCYTPAVVPFDEIADSLFNKQAPPPNKSTLSVMLLKTNSFLFQVLFYGYSEFSLTN